MSCTVAEFRARFPEYSDPIDFPDFRIQLFLDDAANIYMGTDETRWCGKYNYAQCYLAAHLLTLALDAEAGDTSAKLGIVSSKSAGNVSVTRAIMAKDNDVRDEFYMGTTYGVTFLMVRNNCFIGILVTNCQ